MRLRVQEEEVTFNVFNGIKYSVESDCCFHLDSVEAIMSSQVDQIDPLEISLYMEDDEVTSYLMWMDSCGPNKRKYFD